MKRDRADEVAQLVDRYGRMVFATAYRVLGNADDAEDVSQEVFLKLLASRGNHMRRDAVHDWGAYLRVASSHSAVDALRRKSKWRRQSRKLSEEPTEHDVDDPRHIAIRRQAAERLRRALSSLSKRDDLGVLGEMIEAAREDTPGEAEWENARRHLMARLENCGKKRFFMGILRRNEGARVKWATATLALGLVVALAVMLNPRDCGPSQAFAAAVEQLRNARTMTYKIVIEDIESDIMPRIQMEMAFKEPGYTRQDYMIQGKSSRGAAIADLIREKAICIYSASKQYREMDLADLPPEQSRISLFEEMRALPDRADEALGTREMDGRAVEVFRVTEYGMDKTVWVEAETWELVRVEGEFVNSPGLYAVMTDFQFNVDLDDSLFDLTPPEGYTRMEIQDKTSQPAEEDFIAFLSYWHKDVPGDLFPPTLDPVGLMKFGVEISEATRDSGSEAGDMTKEEEAQAVVQGSLILARGLMFALQMTEENDWRYAGEGVRFGASATPVCWWRPEGSETYRVIYGDLRIEDETPGSWATGFPQGVAPYWDSTNSVRSASSAALSQEVAPCRSSALNRVRTSSIVAARPS
jgi:RNA polymerase sigma factor (sigma-70 family)